MNEPRIRSARRGAVEASLLIILAVLLLLGALATLARGRETSHHAARIELRETLATALESSLDEAWWQLARAYPGRGTASKPPRPDPRAVKALRSEVLGAICARTASPATRGDVIAAPFTAAFAGNAKLTLDAPELTIYSVESGGNAGLVGVRARGRATRGSVKVGMVVEHRRRFEVTDTVIRAGGGTATTLPTVHIIPELVDAEVSES